MTDAEYEAQKARVNALAERWVRPMGLGRRSVMPAKTERQQKFMAMCAHNPSHAKGKCPPKSVAREFSHGPKRGKGK